MKRLLPFALLALCLAWVVAALRPARNTTEFDIAGFGRLPALVNGRVKPLDSVARNALLVLQGRQAVADASGRRLAPAEWLLEVMVRPELADKMKVFEVVHPEVLALLKLDPADGDGKKRFSLEQLRPRFEEISRQARLASQEDGPRRTLFQKEVLKLYSRLDHYQQLRFSIQVPDTKDLLAELTAFQESIPLGVAQVRAKESGQGYDEKVVSDFMAEAAKYNFLAETSNLHLIPPAEGAGPDEWRTFGAGVNEALATLRVPAENLAYAGLARTWARQTPAEFNEIVRLLTGSYESARPELLRKARLETVFNALEPFYKSSLLYVVGFLLAVGAWITLPRELARSAFWVTALAFALATAGILARMWLEGRPPVTNLYSSALFVGWVAVLLCLVIEAIFKNALGAMAAGKIGASTLVIAHYLSLSGDTMEMMRAVLDSNFWLATHVVTIAMGYGATLLAGMFALLYISLGLFSRRLDRETADTLQRIIYGVVCFGTLFSLVGTLLGGIWADQSWGRFWGWDPKENGALIIVLWNAIYLHARWGRIAGPRGLAALAVFGNIVTAWSWFGTNMLGVGLHSYGFNDKGAVALIAFVVSQLLFIVLACVPAERWRSPALRA